MAKIKGNFAVNVSKGSSVGFSGIPGKSSYSFGFTKSFDKAYKKKKNEPGEAMVDPPKTDTPTTPTTPTTPAPPTTSKPAKTGGAKLGGISVNPGTGQVRSTSRKLSYEQVQNKEGAPPIAPENIPESYKPKGTPPSGQQWSEAGKNALESERPRNYVDPEFKPSPDSPEAGAARLKALSDEMGAASKAKRATTKAARVAPETKSQNVGKQFSNTSTLPAVDLTGM